MKTPVDFGEEKRNGTEVTLPGLHTTLHLKMFVASKRKRRFTLRLSEAVKTLIGKNEVYGLEWGDPDISEPLRHVRDRFLRPYATSDANVVEIGPGGGRWTRYMKDVRHLYAVDYHQELLNELKSNHRGGDNVSFIKNNGDDFPSIPDGAADFLWSFDTFVHLDIDIIDRYLGNMRRS